MGRTGIADARGSASRKNKLWKGGALAGSVAFHVALFLFGFSRAAGELVSASDAAGGPVGPVYAVSLVRLSAAGETEAQAAEMRPLLLKLRERPAADGIPLASKLEQDQFASLAGRLAMPDPQRSPSGRPQAADDVKPQGSPSPADARLSKLRERKQQTDEGTDGDTTNSASTGALWGRIEPCWRNLGIKASVPVVVEVTIDGRGGLSTPPKVVRATSALLNEPRLRSEANALAALAACMPRGDVRLAGNTFRLEFPATR